MQRPLITKQHRLFTQQFVGCASVDVDLDTASSAQTQVPLLPTSQCCTTRTPQRSISSTARFVDVRRLRLHIAPSHRPMCRPHRWSDPGIWPTSCWRRLPWALPPAPVPCRHRQPPPQRGLVRRRVPDRPRHPTALQGALNRQSHSFGNLSFAQAWRPINPCVTARHQQSTMSF